MSSAVCKKKRGGKCFFLEGEGKTCVCGESFFLEEQKIRSGDSFFLFFFLLGWRRIFFLLKLALFALNSERHWGRRPKVWWKSGSKCSVTIYIFGVLKNIFFITGCPKMVWILTFNFRKWRKKGQHLDHFWDTL